MHKAPVGSAFLNSESGDTMGRSREGETIQTTLLSLKGAVRLFDKKWM